MYRIIPIVISFLLLSAHYFRSGELGLVAMWVSAPLLLFVKRRWVSYAFTAMLFFGASVWIKTAKIIWEVRSLYGMPKTNVMLILGGVALFTAASGLLFFSAPLKRRYKRDPDSDIPESAAFFLTLFILVMVQINMSPPGLLLERFIYGGGYLEAFWLSVYAAILVKLMKSPKSALKWRPRLWALFSTVFFSQLVVGLLGDERFLMTGKLHLPVPALIVGGPLYRGGGFFMLTLFVVTVLLVGPAWCSWLCYIGAWDDSAARLSKKHTYILDKWKYVRIATLILTVVAAFSLRYFEVSASRAAYMPAAFLIVGIFLMLFWSRKTGVMTHCTSYCPIGFLSCKLGRLNPFRVRISDGCDGCNRCMPYCRYNALLEKDIKEKRPGDSCTLCGDCVAACEDGNVKFTFFSLTGENARVLFIVMVCSLHAAFIGVARI